MINSFDAAVASVMLMRGVVVCHIAVLSQVCVKRDGESWSSASRLSGVCGSIQKKTQLKRW